MPLFTVKTSKKVETSMMLEESTAKMLDRYAHYHKASAEDVVNEALEYIFQRDKGFQQVLTARPNEEAPASVRVIPRTPVKAPKKRANSSEPAPTTAAATAK